MKLSKMTLSKLIKLLEGWQKIVVGYDPSFSKNTTDRIVNELEDAEKEYKREKKKIDDLQKELKPSPKVIKNP